MIPTPTVSRPALAAALLLTPDNRPSTRRAVIRGAVLSERYGAASMPRPARRRLLRGFARGQQAWIGVGMAFYKLNRTKPWAVPLFTMALIFGAYQLIGALAGAAAR